jgi:hypothetical protein
MLGDDSLNDDGVARGHDLLAAVRDALARGLLGYGVVIARKRASA